MNFKFFFSFDLKEIIFDGFELHSNNFHNFNLACVFFFHLQQTDEPAKKKRKKDKGGPLDVSRFIDTEVAVADDDDEEDFDDDEAELTKEEGLIFRKKE